MDLVTWAHYNVLTYSLIIILITVIICWFLRHRNEDDLTMAEHLKAGMVGKTVNARNTAVLMDRIHGSDGMTVVDKEFEKIMLQNQLAQRV